MNRSRGAFAFLRTLPLAELFTLARFLIIGIAATALHIVVALVAIRVFEWGVFPANFLAFMAGFSLAFMGHYYYTFRAAANYRQALMRYFIISGTAFAVNNVILVALVKSDLLSDIVSVILAAAIIPLISYTASRLWGFRAQ